MHWLYDNINHFTAPLGILFALVAFYMNWRRRRKLKRGELRPYLSEAVRNSLFVLIICAAVLLGFALARNFS